MAVGVATVFVLGMTPAVTAAPGAVRFAVDHAETTYADVTIDWTKTKDECDYDWTAKVVGASPLDNYDWKVGQTQPYDDFRAAKDDRGPVVERKPGGDTVSENTTVTVVAHIEDSNNPKDTSHAEESFTC